MAGNRFSKREKKLEESYEARNEAQKPTATAAEEPRASEGPAVKKTRLAAEEEAAADARATQPAVRKDERAVMDELSTLHGLRKEEGAPSARIRKTISIDPAIDRTCKLAKAMGMAKSESEVIETAVAAYLPELYKSTCEMLERERRQ